MWLSLLFGWILRVSCFCCCCYTSNQRKMTYIYIGNEERPIFRREIVGLDNVSKNQIAKVLSKMFSHWFYNREPENAIIISVL